MRSIVSVAALAAVASASTATTAASSSSTSSSGSQYGISTYSSSLNMTINPASVPSQTRSEWCQGQINTCQLLCDQQTSSISCSPSTLAWNCTCASNNSMPGLQYYVNTMPTYICQELFEQCITSHTSSAQAQQVCKDNIGDLCGTLAASSSVASSSSSAVSSSTMSPSTTGKSSATGSSTGSSAHSTSSGLAAPTMAPVAGTVGSVIIAGIGALAYLL